MNKIWKILNTLVLTLLIIICLLGTFYKHISFGLGLGDMIGYLFLYLTTLVHIILTFFSWNKGYKRFIIFTVVFLVLLIYICFIATIGRGSEYSWNGNIFYLPCSKEIVIENQDLKKKLQVSMCSMEYYSEFNGKWNGHYLVLNEGNIKIPEELKEYIDFPINKVEIEPDYFYKDENDKLVTVDCFKTDTLKIGKNYRLSGEIEKIRNSKPVMKVTINNRKRNID